MTFHETQVKAFCGLHAINNLAQMAAWTSKELIKIARHLETVVELPHCTDHGWFSVEVLEIASRQAGWKLIRVDSEDDISRLQRIKGFIIHDDARQHWWSMRIADGLTWAHDSILPAPAPILDPAALRSVILASKGTIFAVQEVGMGHLGEYGTLLPNQRRRSAKEFQELRDERVARELHFNELVKSRQENPPPFSGFSPGKAGAPPHNTASPPRLMQTKSAQAKWIKMVQHPLILKLLRVWTLRLLAHSQTVGFAAHGQ